MTDILAKLRGGDLRSIGQANEVVLEVKKNSAHFEAVFGGLYDHHPVVRMRSADVIERESEGKGEKSKQDFGLLFLFLMGLAYITLAHFSK